MKKCIILIMTLVIAVFSLMCGCNNTNEVVNEQPVQEETQVKEETPVVEPKEETPIVQPKTEYDYFCDFMKANGTIMALDGKDWLMINVTTESSDSATCFLGLCPSDKQVILYSEGKETGWTTLYKFAFGNYSRTAYNGYCKIVYSGSMYAEYLFKATYSASSHSFTYCNATWAGGTISSRTLDADSVANYCQLCTNLVYTSARILFISEPTLGVDFDLFA